MKLPPYSTPLLLRLYYKTGDIAKAWESLMQTDIPRSDETKQAMIKYVLECAEIGKQPEIRSNYAH